jgi:hypothetical protein
MLAFSPVDPAMRTFIFYSIPECVASTIEKGSFRAEVLSRWRMAGRAWPRRMQTERV